MPHKGAGVSPGQMSHIGAPGKRGTAEVDGSRGLRVAHYPADAESAREGGPHLDRRPAEVRSGPTTEPDSGDMTCQDPAAGPDHDPCHPAEGGGGQGVAEVSSAGQHFASRAQASALMCGLFGFCVPFPVWPLPTLPMRGW